MCGLSNISGESYYGMKLSFHFLINDKRTQETTLENFTSSDQGWHIATSASVNSLRNRANQRFSSVRVDPRPFNSTTTAIRISGIAPLRNVSTLFSQCLKQAAPDLCTGIDHTLLNFQTCCGLSYYCRCS